MPNLSLVQTLFGGMLFIGVLYFLLRLAGLSTYWRGVISGFLPLLAYTAYFMATQPGGDVLSVHVAVYIATAAVMTIMDTRGRPQEGRRHWAPWVIVGFFGIVVVLQALFLIVATQGLPISMAKWLLPGTGDKAVHTGFPGVVHHDPGSAKTVASYLKQEEKEHRLGWKVTFSGLDALHVNVPTEILAVAVDGKGLPLDAAHVSLQIKRVAVAGDTREYGFTAIRDGQYRMLLTLTTPGLWDARLVVRRGDDKYELQRVLDVRQPG